MRKIMRTRGHFPADEAAVKLLWHALRHITAKWKRTAYYWRPATKQFAIPDEGRFTPAVRSPASHTKFRILPLPTRTDQRQLLAPPALVPCTNQR
jgi:hypothetical protein